MKRRGYYIISPHGEARANILENDNLHIQVEFSAKLSQELYLKKANIILQKIDKRQRTAVTDVRMVGGKHAAIDLVRVWRIVGVGILEAAWIVEKQHFRNRPVNDFNEGGGKRRWINVSQQPVRRNDEIKEAICLNDWREVSVIDKRRPN